MTDFIYHTFATGPCAMKATSLSKQNYQGYKLTFSSAYPGLKDEPQTIVLLVEIPQMGIKV